jgi:hypothetical protein
VLEVGRIGSAIRSLCHPGLILPFHQCLLVYVILFVWFWVFFGGTGLNALIYCVILNKIFYHLSASVFLSVKW